MELGLQFEDIFCYEASPKVVSTHEESLETAIPEYCPDIARIVDTTGHLSIRERQLAEGRCTVSGSVKVTVLYTSEEAAGLRSLSVSVPFSYVLDERSLAGCGTICAQGRVLLAEARAVTSRKSPLPAIGLSNAGSPAVHRRNPPFASAAARSRSIFWPQYPKRDSPLRMISCWKAAACRRTFCCTVCAR